MDLHPRACFTKEHKGNWHSSYYTWLKSLQTPIFMQECWPDVPMAVRYPIERILAEFRAYFTNHCAWMIALAMTEGIKQIGLFGCQYGAGGEYAVQRGSLEYWLGRFEQFGGQVVLPPKFSDVLNYPSRLYGYESHDEDTGRLVEEYRVRRTGPTQTLPDGRQLTILDQSKPEDWPVLAVPPNGEPIAYDRAPQRIAA